MGRCGVDLASREKSNPYAIEQLQTLFQAVSTGKCEIDLALRKKSKTIMEQNNPKQTIRLDST